MSTKHRLLATTFALAALAPACAAQANAVLQEHTQGPVTYVTGGVGTEEADAMRQAAASYPLTLEMASAAGGPRDAYISNAKVDIRDAQGKTVLEATAEGPFVLVKLPSGTYKVAINWHGAQREKTVEVGRQRQHLMFEFPDVPGNH